MTNRQKSAAKHEFQIWPGFYLPGTSRLYIPACALLIVALAVVVYWPSISGGFIFDDDLYLTDNQIVKSANGLYRIWLTTEPTDYYPLSNTALWLEWRLWGMNPTGYHVTNLLLHIAEAMLIWIILRKLSIPGGFLAAMLFAVHPVNVETVAWIAQLKEMLAMLFFLLAILWYIKGAMPEACSHGGRWEQEVSVHGAMPTRSMGMTSGIGNTSMPTLRVGMAPNLLFWYWLSLSAFILAMLSKASAAVLPVVLLGIIWRLKTFTRREILKTIPFFLAALLLTLVHAWFQTHGSGEVYRSAGFIERLLGAGAVIWFYLYKALWPFDLAFIYPQWQIDPASLLWWLPLVAAIAVTVVLFWHRKGWARPFFMAWGFFCIALLPVMGFVDPGFMKYSLVADHYQHIAIIGVIALAAAGFSLGQRQKIIRPAADIAIVAAVTVLALFTWQQNKLYSDPVTLYRTTLEKNPDCWMCYDNLGSILTRQGHIQEAMANYEQALRLKHDAKTYNNIGAALFEQGDFEKAIEYYNMALQITSDYPDASINLSKALLRTGRAEDAVKICEQVAASKPQYAEAHFNLGNALVQAGRMQEAIEHYEQALRLNSNYAEAYNNLGYALLQTGRAKEAIEHYETALQIKPGYINALKNLAFAYASTNQSSQAIAAAQMAIKAARSQGQTDQAGQIEKWLNSYSAGARK